ncbi:MAG: hypothetical protein JWM36_4442 [Hyphomicrobiales bacterium]|nr:hypothetical protein [Hyphomicrobiales bacterium]
MATQDGRSATGGAGPIFIGTAGWSIPKIHQDGFPQTGTHLERYGSTFQATEINSSFYRHHRRSTYERWAASVTELFRFSVKVPKTITHSGQLAVTSELDTFLSEIGGLGTKLGPLLLQFPPKQTFMEAESASFLTAIRERVAGPIACEPRHASWFGNDVDDLFSSLRIARVAADPPRAEGADVPGGWTRMAYYRLHGSPQIYYSPYGEERLESIAQQLVRNAQAGVETWCIFDNTTSYAATGDALTTMRLTRTHAGVR